jgi:acyl-CoA reductase-like NAD-dependent aldehyde dehydrogenase
MGATVASGGTVTGNCLHPTILTGVTREMKVMCSKVFAPIVSVVPFDSFEEALEMADDSVYGLQAGIYTNSIDKAFRAVKRLDVGGSSSTTSPLTGWTTCPTAATRRAVLAGRGSSTPWRR